MRAEAGLEEAAGLAEKEEGEALGWAGAEAVTGEREGSGRAVTGLAAEEAAASAMVEVGAEAGSELEAAKERKGWAAADWVRAGLGGWATKVGLGLAVAADRAMEAAAARG